MEKTNQSSSLKARVINITSIILGMISVLWILLFIFLPQSLRINLFGYYDWQLPLYFIIFIPASILGLIFGIIGLKSIKKNLAILGIILSALALMLWLSWLFIYVGFSYY